MQLEVLVSLNCSPVTEYSLIALTADLLQQILRSMHLSMTHSPISVLTDDMSHL